MWDKFTATSLLESLSNATIPKKSSSISHEEIENSLESLNYVTEKELYSDLGQQCASSSSGVFNATTDADTTSNEEDHQEEVESEPDETLVEKSEVTSSENTQHSVRKVSHEASHPVSEQHLMNIRSSLVWKREIPSSKWKSLSCPSMIELARSAADVGHSDSSSNASISDVSSTSDEDSSAMEHVNAKAMAAEKMPSFLHVEQPILRDSDIDFIYRRSFIDTSTYSVFSSEDDSGTDEDYHVHPTLEVSENYSFTETSSRDSGSSEYLLMPPLPSERNINRRPLMAPPPVTLLRRSPGVLGMSALAQKSDAELEALMLEASKKRHFEYHAASENLLPRPIPVSNNKEAPAEEFDIPYMDDSDSDDETALITNKRGKQPFKLQMKKAEMDECSLDFVTEDIEINKHVLGERSVNTTSPKQRIQRRKSFLSSMASRWSFGLLKLCSCTRKQD